MEHFLNDSEGKNLHTSNVLNQMKTSNNITIIKYDYKSKLHNTKDITIIKLT